MKKFKQYFIIFWILSLSSLIFAMEEQNIQHSNYEEIQSYLLFLPNELLIEILSNVLMDRGSACQTIHTKLDSVKSYIQESLKNISLTCKLFLALKPYLIKLKPKYLEFYRSLLTNEFLKLKDYGDTPGLYPSSKHWIWEPFELHDFKSGLVNFDLCKIEKLESKIANFLLTQNNTNNPILAKIWSDNRLNLDIRLKLTKLLLFYGANVNTSDKKGNAALSLAITPKYMTTFISAEAVELLLKNKANPNAINKDGFTPLILACRKSCFSFDEQITICKILNLLLEYGADANITSNYGTALIEATVRKHQIIVGLLLAIPYININAKDQWGRTAKDITRRDSKEIENLLNNHNPVPTLKAICLRQIRTRANN